MSQLEPRVKELTSQTSFIGVAHRRRQGGLQREVLELCEEAQQTCGDVDFGLR